MAMTDAEIEEAAEQLAQEEYERKVIADIRKNLGSQSSAKTSLVGIGSRIDDALTGVGQLGARAFGDEELLKRLNQHMDDKRLSDAAIFGDEELGIEPYLQQGLPLTDKTFNPASLGGFAATALPSLAAGGVAGALLTRGASSVPALVNLAENTSLGAKALRALNAIGIGSGGGYVSGKAIPLTEVEEKQNQSARNAKLGALLGGVVPASLMGAKGGFDLTKKLLTHEAADDAGRTLARELGYGGESFGELSRRLRGAIEGKYQSLKEAARQLYDDAEVADGLPNVVLRPSSFDPLTGTLNIGSLDIPAVKGASANYTLKKMRDGASGMTFREARDLRRELLASMRGMQPDSVGYRGGAEVLDALDSGLEKWATLSDEAKAAALKASEADRFFKENVLPFESPKSVLGGYRQGRNVGASADDISQAYPFYVKSFEDELLRPTGAPAMQEILMRVPESQDALRKLWARKSIGLGSTDATAAGIYGDNPLKELVPDDDSFYRQALKIGEAKRGQELPFSLQSLAKRLPLGDVVLTGVSPRGYADVAPTRLDTLIGSSLLSQPSQSVEDDDTLARLLDFLGD